MRQEQRGANPSVTPLGAVLHRLEDPVFVIDGARRVEFANASALLLVGENRDLRLQAGRLTFGSAGNRLEFERLSTQILGRADARSGSSALRLRRERAHKDWLLLLSLLAGESRSDPRLLLRLVSRVRSRRLPVQVLRDLFALSDRELALLKALLQGKSLREVAAATSMSFETVRTYLKRIFAKCDVRSQTELLGLLQRLALFEPE
jgi:DNA-binding CsgD family transcriptional regulator